MPQTGTSVAIKQAITQTLNTTQGHKRSYQTRYFVRLLMPHRDTSVALNQAITQSLSTTQGHKRSYQTIYFSGSKCHNGTEAFAIYQAHNRSLPITRYDLNLNILTGVKLLYTVIKAEF